VAYQALDDNWRMISIDLEIIQTEGFESIKQVNPRLVMKKKDGKEEEVQDGWIGHIIPFELVQQTILVKEALALKEKEDRLNEILVDYEEILESLTEEEKDSDFLNEAKDSFVAAVVAKDAKRVNSELMKNITFGDDSLEMKIVKIDSMIPKKKN
jgi:type I restriction enzyme M protein